MNDPSHLKSRVCLERHNDKMANEWLPDKKADTASCFIVFFTINRPSLSPEELAHNSE